ncbi:MAG: hypothetical protein K2N74_04115, partial [Clostridiales bacterium]|nr:hypothetical protein [Clostridiales bacterium]
MEDLTQQSVEEIPAADSAVGESAAAVEEKKVNVFQKYFQKFKDSKFARNFKSNWTYLLFLIPAVAVTFIFAYIPIYGILIAFQDYMPGDSIMGANTIWVGFDNFARFFNDYMFWALMGNTFLLCILGFLIGFPLPIIVALLLHSKKNKKLSKFLKTVFNGP